MALIGDGHVFGDAYRGAIHDMIAAAHTVAAHRRRGTLTIEDLEDLEDADTRLNRLRTDWLNTGGVPSATSGQHPGSVDRQRVIPHPVGTLPAVDYGGRAAYLEGSPDSASAHHDDGGPP